MNPQLKENRIIQEKAYLNIKNSLFVRCINMDKFKRKSPKIGLINYL
jgi:hypothetical protein